MFNFWKKITAGELTASGIPETYLHKMSSTLVEKNEIAAEFYTKYNVKRGLRNANGTGVIVGLTQISEVNGYTVSEQGEKIPEQGSLFYRGYNIEDLVASYVSENRFGFEEVTYLLLFGELPTRAELAEFVELISAKRELPPGFARDMILTTPSRSIMNKLARSVLALYCYDEDPDNTSIENVLRQSIDLMGYFPALIAYAYQAKSSFFDNQSLHLHNPLPTLSTAENILRMIRPTGEYTEMEAKVLDICLVLHAEHGGGNNSTFTTHVISSSGSDTYSTISAAVGSLKGPKHGGANLAVISMLDDLKKHVKDITNPNEVEDYLTKVLKGEANDGTGLVYGMGHAIYTLSDPRAVLLRGMAKELAKNKGLEADFQLCEYIAEMTPRLYTKVTGIDKPLSANVDLYSGFVYNALDIPMDIATPLFAVARLSGWAAHRMEELIAGKRLIRPAYVNVLPYRDFIEINARKEHIVATTNGNGNGNGNGKAPKAKAASKAPKARRTHTTKQE
jgi:citrate synthase